jgi:hypothetical protein
MIATRFGKQSPRYASREERRTAGRPQCGRIANKSARAMAAALNERKIPTPADAAWHSVTVIRVQKRLGLTQ